MPSSSPPASATRLARLAGKVARIAVLESVRLKQSTLENGVELGERTRVRPKYSLNVQLRISKNAPRFVVTVEINAGGYKDSDSTNDPTAFKCVPKFELVYSLPKESAVKPGAIEAFAQFHAPADAWPYFREYIHSSMASMGLPSFALNPYIPEKFWKLDRVDGALHRAGRPKVGSRR